MEWAKEDDAGYWAYYCVWLLLLVVVLIVVGHGLRCSGFGAVAVVVVGNFHNVDVVDYDYTLD
jgi:hypothetical protein